MGGEDVVSSKVTVFVALPDVPVIVTISFPGQITSPATRVNTLVVVVFTGLNE